MRACSFAYRYETYCTDNYGNDKCDMGCNTAACGWDGLDCDAKAAPEFADDVLVSCCLWTFFIPLLG